MTRAKLEIGFYDPYEYARDLSFMKDRIAATDKLLKALCFIDGFLLNMGKESAR